VREERIKVRGEPDQVLMVRETRHGPVISDLVGAQQILAVSMANLASDNTAAAGLLALNQATNIDEARASAAMITSPVQNLLVADHERIALFVTGRVPFRRTGDGAIPVPGDGSHDWIGWASGDKLPQYVAPASGRLVNANDRVAPPDFPMFLGRDWFGDWRAQRIRQLLDGSDKHTVADFARMQVDVHSTFARQALPALLSVPVNDDTSRRAQALLRDWDGSMTMDAPQPLIFNAWIHFFYGRVLQQADVPRGDGGPLLEFVAHVLSPAGAHWCGGDCTSVLQASLGDAITDLTRRFGGDPAKWRWGEAHPAVFAHPILRPIPILGTLGTLSIPSPGDDSTIDRGGPAYKQFQSVHGAEYRGVYDLADLDRSLFVVAPGQSGNLLSRHARDFLARWRDGGTITLGPNAATTTATIRLTP
jgi:penicillin amidase